jgi:hypothetical protein
MNFLALSSIGELGFSSSMLQATSVVTTKIPGEIKSTFRVLISQALHNEILLMIPMNTSTPLKAISNACKTTQEFRIHFTSQHSRLIKNEFH